MYKWFVEFRAWRYSGQSKESIGPERTHVLLDGHLSFQDVAKLAATIAQAKIDSNPAIWQCDVVRIEQRSAS
jgi:hypothetical protein